MEALTDHSYKYVDGLLEYHQIDNADQVGCSNLLKTFIEYFISNVLGYVTPTAQVIKWELSCNADDNGEGPNGRRPDVAF